VLIWFPIALVLRTAILHHGADVNILIDRLGTRIRGGGSLHASYRAILVDDRVHGWAHRPLFIRHDSFRGEQPRMALVDRDHSERFWRFRGDYQYFDRPHRVCQGGGYGCGYRQ
jgi:hypothetical protein